MRLRSTTFAAVIAALGNSPVSNNRTPRDPAGLGGAQEKRDAGDIVGLTNTPERRRGNNARTSFRKDPAVMSVSITPGAMALTVMPFGPSSLLQAWVKVTTAAFEAE